MHHKMREHSRKAERHQPEGELNRSLWAYTHRLESARRAVCGRVQGGGVAEEGDSGELSGGASVGSEAGAVVLVV